MPLKPNVKMSIVGGKINIIADVASTPINEIIAPRLGIAIASETKSKRNNNLIINYSKKIILQFIRFDNYIVYNCQFNSYSHVKMVRLMRKMASPKFRFRSENKR